MPQRFFFVHVMKTAGTTLALQLQQQFHGAEIYPAAEVDGTGADNLHLYTSVRQLLALSPERRAAIRLYSGHFPFVASELVGVPVTTITLLREPVERTISVLKHFKRLHERYRDASLEEIYDDEVVFSLFVHNHQTQIFSVQRADDPDAFSSSLDYESIFAALSPQRDPASVAAVAGSRIVVDSERLAAAKSNLAATDVVGLTADYAGFVGELRRRFGWWPGGLNAAARANVSSEDWSGGAALRARIAGDNEYDVELYRYAAALVAGRTSPLREDSSPG